MTSAQECPQFCGRGVDGDSGVFTVPCVLVGVVWIGGGELSPRCPAPGGAPREGMLMKSSLRYPMSKGIPCPGVGIQVRMLYIRG